MELIAVTQTLIHIHKNIPDLTQEEQEIAARFVLRTGDLELTNKLLLELAQQGVEKEKVRQRFAVLMEPVSPLSERLEGVLIALEQYRIQQERTIKLLEGILFANQAVKAVQSEEQRKKAEEIEQQKKEEKEEDYVRRNSAGGANYPGRL
jgi:hypothetical protein